MAEQRIMVLLLIFGPFRDSLSAQTRKRVVHFNAICFYFTGRSRNTVIVKFNSDLMYIGEKAFSLVFNYISLLHH